MSGLPERRQDSQEQPDEPKALRNESGVTPRISGPLLYSTSVPTIRITVDRRLAETAEQLADRFGQSDNTMRRTLSRLVKDRGLTPAGYLDRDRPGKLRRQPVYFVADVTKLRRS